MKPRFSVGDPVDVLLRWHFDEPPMRKTGIVTRVVSGGAFYDIEQRDFAGERSLAAIRMLNPDRLEHAANPHTD